MTSLIRYWKEIAIVVLLAILVFGNNKYDQLTEKYNLQLTENTKLKENTRIVEKIVEVKPDGTKVVTDRTTDTETEKDTSTDKKEERIVEKKDTKKYYSISVFHPLDASLDVKALEVNAGMRLFHSNLWGEIGYNNQYKQVSLGIRFEF